MRICRFHTHDILFSQKTRKCRLSYTKIICAALAGAQNKRLESHDSLQTNKNVLWKTSTQHLKRKRLVDLFVDMAILTTHSPGWCFTLDTLPSNGHHGSKTKFDSPCTGTTPVISETSRMKNGCLGFLKIHLYPQVTSKFPTSHQLQARTHISRKSSSFTGVEGSTQEHHVGCFNMLRLWRLFSASTPRASATAFSSFREKTPVCMSLRSVSFPVDLVNASAEF